MVLESSGWGIIKLKLSSSANCSTGNACCSLLLPLGGSDATISGDT